MNQDKYLELLSQYLHELPEEQVDKIIQNYRGQFQIQLAKGKSEKEIIRELGHPRIISKSFIDVSDIPRKRAVKSRSFIIAIAKASIILIVTMAVIIALNFLVFSKY